MVKEHQIHKTFKGVKILFVYTKLFTARFSVLTMTPTAEYKRIPHKYKLLVTLKRTLEEHHELEGILMSKYFIAEWMLVALLLLPVFKG